MGWRMQSLNGAADSILKSASRLEEEMEKEATYWNQVLAVKEKGWSLSRLPREKHTLGIRYGFAEGRILRDARSMLDVDIQSSSCRFSRPRSSSTATRC